MPHDLAGAHGRNSHAPAALRHRGRRDARLIPSPHTDTAMTVQDLMTSSPATCTPDTSLQDVARTMADEDCGALPVVASEGSNEPVGVVTDRDIAIRIVATGQNPADKTAADAMTKDAVTVRASASVEEAARMMKDRQLRRLIVVGDDGAITGILAQADLARAGHEARTGEVVEEISKPSR